MEPTTAASKWSRADTLAHPCLSQPQSTCSCSVWVGQVSNDGASSACTLLNPAKSQVCVCHLCIWIGCAVHHDKKRGWHRKSQLAFMLLHVHTQTQLLAQHSACCMILLACVSSYIILNYSLLLQPIAFIAFKFLAVLFFSMCKLGSSV